MLSTVLEYVNITAVACAVAFSVGVLFSQKIKDWFTGVPSELRTALSSLEGKAQADIAVAKADVAAKIAPAPAKVPVVAASAPAPGTAHGADPHAVMMATPPTPPAQ